MSAPHTPGAEPETLAAAEPAPASEHPERPERVDERIEEVEHALAGARPRDPAATALARARIESALFGAAPGVGRFHVLEPLGRGGMGVVYAAYDPELDRGVALKMIHVPAHGRELAVAEAKSLARVSHPNIVPVFDVGVLDDHVYIVMELVRGVTLREWVKGRPLRQIVEIYLQAGAALAAAHAAGLVHRDFKPDNAIVGSDGRVRVVDFGLACEADPGPPGESGSAALPLPLRRAGTPRYMAPEQAAGSITPASDQYSFCVALGEALAPSGPVPRWLGEILDRGRAADPAQRYRSMQELQRALGRSPARARRRQLALGVLAVALGLGFLVGRLRVADGPEPCSGGDFEIAAAWPIAARDAQLARIARLGAYGDELARRVATGIAGHATQWAAQQRDACLTHRRGVESDALLDRRMTCLARSRAAVAAVAEIAAAADAANLPDLARAASAIPDPAGCTAAEALAGGDPPPPALAPRIAQLRGELERARIQLAAGRSTSARQSAHAAAEELRGLGYPPLYAEALLVEGHAAMRADPAGAQVALRAATDAAFAAGRDALAIEAWARREWLAGRANPDTAFAGLDVIEALAQRTGGFARALLLNNVGSTELARGRRSEARAAFERALEVARGVRGPEAVELVTVRRNLALVVDDPGVRQRLLADARDELAQRLGDDHPDTLLADYAYASTGLFQIRDAASRLATTCPRFALHESLAALVPTCLVELADLRAELGDLAGAADACANAIDRGGATSQDVPELPGYLALWRGDAAGAIAAFERALEDWPEQPGAPFQLAYLRATLELGHARALRAAGRAAQARAAAERSLRGMRDIDERSTLMLQRRLYRAHAEAAIDLAATRGDPAQIRAHAAAAIDWYRRTGGGAAAERAQLAELARGVTGSP